MSVHVQDKEKNQNHYLRGDILSTREPSRTRMDLQATTLGVYVGSLLIQNDRTQLLLSRQRRYFEGSSSPQFLWRLTKVPLDPRDLHRLIWGAGLDRQNWNCERHQVDEMVCEHRRYYLKVTRKSEDISQSQLHFETDSADVRMNLTLSQTKVERPEQAFQLDPPKGFRIQSLD